MKCGKYKGHNTSNDGKIQHGQEFMDMNMDELYGWDVSWKFNEE